MKRVVLACVMVSFLVGVLSSSIMAEIRYTVTDLGKGSAYSINNIGQIVGASDDGPADPGHATLFDTPSGHGNNVNLGGLGGNYSWAYSINNNGQIVGFARDNSGYKKATLFDPTGNGNNVNLGAAGSYNNDGQFINPVSSAAYSINDNGQIVGWEGADEWNGHATLFDSSGQGDNSHLGPFQNYSYGVAYSINNNGQIVGFANYNYLKAATLFDPSGNENNIDLGSLGGNLTEYNEAYFINNSGQIVGKARDGTGNYFATLFDPSGNGHNINLGTLPGRPHSEAYCINNNGQIVGYADDMMGHGYATLFDATGKGNNIDLNTVVDAPLGWHLSFAWGINDNGWIVGEGNMGAFLLKPVPEPATILLLVGGFVLSRRKR